MNILIRKLALGHGIGLLIAATALLPHAASATSSVGGWVLSHDASYGFNTDVHLNNIYTSENVRPSVSGAPGAPQKLFGSIEYDPTVAYFCFDPKAAGLCAFSSGMAFYWDGPSRGIANGDVLAFSYRFTVYGDVGTRWSLFATFNGGELPGTGAAMPPDTAAIASGALTSRREEFIGTAYSAPHTGGSDTPTWQVLINVDGATQDPVSHAWLPPTSVLGLDVPSHSIDMALNMPPVMDAVPEAGSASLMLTGLIASGLCMRRRARR